MTEGNRLCDVGCDHAFLPIALVQEGRIPAALAMDVREGPLAIAAGNVAEAGLDDRIETRLSDGLEALRPGEADTIVLAGMGGRLVLDILAKGIDVAQTVREWILQPQSDVAEVRRWLRLSGFAAADEEMVRERGKFYTILQVKTDGAPLVLQEDAALADSFGAVLLEKRHPVLREFLEKEYGRIGHILDGLSDIDNSRKKELLEEYHMVRSALERWKRI